MELLIGDVSWRCYGVKGLGPKVETNTTSPAFTTASAEDCPICNVIMLQFLHLPAAWQVDQLNL